MSLMYDFVHNKQNWLHRERGVVLVAVSFRILHVIDVFSHNKFVLRGNGITQMMF